MKTAMGKSGASEAAEPLRVYVVAGEASGDQHAAPLMRAIRALSPRPVAFRGIGGPAMRAEGQEQLLDCDSIAVVGFWEVIRRIGFFMRLFRDTKRDIAAWKPDILLTVDYPGFNIRLAAAAKAMGIAAIHYICPQVWVWHRDRIWKIAKALDGLVTIFPFEPECFAPTTLRPVFAGHPLVDRAAETLGTPPAPLPWGPGHRIGLLPGSRPSEVDRLLPGMLGAAAILERRYGGEASFVIPASSPTIHARIDGVIASAAARPSNLAVVDGLAREVMRQSETAAIASGTATLEASLMLCPTVLVYKGPWLTYHLAKIVLRRVGCIGLANLISGRIVMPELLQYDFTPDNLAGHLARYIEDGAARDEAVAALRKVNATLGEGDSARRAAKAVLEIYRDKCQASRRRV